MPIYTSNELILRHMFDASLVESECYIYTCNATIRRFDILVLSRQRSWAKTVGFKVRILTESYIDFKVRLTASIKL